MSTVNGSSEENPHKDVNGGPLPSSEEFKRDKYTDKILHLIFGYKITKKFTDVVLLAGERRIFAHKMILIAASEYFSAMFAGNLKEANQAEVTLEGVDGEALESLINYCYTGSINLHEDTVELLLSTASLLQLNDVVEACSDFLLKRIHPSNCLGIASFADQHSCLPLQKRANEYIYENFVEVSKQSEFLSLGKDNLATLLLSDYLNVPSEEFVLECIVSWINHDLPERRQYAQQMLELVKLPLVSQDYLLFNTESTFGHIKEYNVLILKALQLKKQLPSNEITPRRSTLGKLFAVGKSADNSNIVVNFYNPRINSWSELTKLEFKKTDFGVAVIDERVFLIGGKEGNNISSEHKCLNLNTLMLNYNSYNPMQSRCYGFAVAVINNCHDSVIYAIGGKGHQNNTFNYGIVSDLSSAARWNLSTNTWVNIPSMSQARYDCGAAVLGGKIYVVGGQDGDNVLNSIEMYCPLSNKWEKCKSMIEERAEVGVVADGKYIYAIGGRKSREPSSRLASVERYDPETDTWSFVASLSIARSSIGTCLLGNKLIAVGGHDGVKCLQIVEEYDAQKDEWTPLESLPTATAITAVVCLKNGLAC